MYIYIEKQGDQLFRQKYVLKIKHVTNQQNNLLIQFVVEEKDYKKKKTF